jgi:hypothetical protein
VILFAGFGLVVGAQSMIAVEFVGQVVAHSSTTASGAANSVIAVTMWYCKNFVGDCLQDFTIIADFAKSSTKSIVSTGSIGSAAFVTAEFVGCWRGYCCSLLPSFDGHYFLSWRKG